MTIADHMSESDAKAQVRERVSASAFQTLETFVGAVEAWATTTNLVARADQGRLWARHVLDSIQLPPLAPPGPKQWVDLGAGAGFPGFIVAIIDEDADVTLVESNRKKAAFLTQAAAKTGVAITVKPVRAEALPPNAADVVSARALAPLPRLLTLAEPLFGPSTLGLFMKGREGQAEVAEARKTFDFTVTHHNSDTAPDASVVAITELERR